MTPNWKLERVKNLSDEVKDLHPVLRELFRCMPSITEVNYTQGNREMGADFVLTRYDDELMEQDYVGVIVKSTSIKQNHEDVRRQIRECEVARPIENGKKEIHLNEIWIITSQDITRSAQDSIHHEHKNTKIKFFDCEKLVKLLDRFYPTYWDFTNLKINRFIAKQLTSIDAYGSTHSLTPQKSARIELDQKIIRILRDDNKRFQRKAQKAVSLINEIKKNRFIYVQGSMGAGKSELVRDTAKRLCEQQTLENFTNVPYFTSFREIKNSGLEFGALVSRIESELDDTSKTIILFIDGLDETDESMDEKVDYICSAAESISALTHIKMVVTSRIIQQEKQQEKIEKHFDRYAICDLSYSAIINVIEALCENLKVTTKFKDDLQNSSLMKALPRTPLSAILLGRLMAENVKELPSTLPELYSKYTELVLGRWDIQKGNGSEKEYETIQRIISYVAGYMTDNDLEFLGVGELETIFTDYLKIRRTGQDARMLMKSFVSKAEIIGFDMDKNAIFFKHKTFKEFFYATLQFQQKGIEAPIKKPFDLYWQGIEYFYLGLIKDAPTRIEQISRLVPENELESLVKLASFSDFLLAAYQTPYKEIETALSRTFFDAAVLYSDIVAKKQESWLHHLPELQLLCMLTMAIKKAYSYDFFLPALHEAKILAEMDGSLSEEQRNVLLFFVDSVLANLGDDQAFIGLVENHSGSLSWTLRLGINFSSQDAQFINSATKQMYKKINKSSKNNFNLQKYFLELQDKPLNERKDLGITKREAEGGK
ncbi:NACHT domain-containing protein [Pseudomonas coronafaciens]|uniref:NACHT domain-containing protein n=1 Tax=Pseudomonas coronafaciens TaxID=53409 RepID=UPI0011C41ECE|nr:P-loop NTPase fold protein [Pseudomonas coronafaciens]